MTVGEALTNLVWARITALGDVKASCNWMWAAKFEREGSKVRARRSVRECVCLCEGVCMSVCIYVNGSVQEM